MKGGLGVAPPSPKSRKIKTNYKFICSMYE